MNTAHFPAFAGSARSNIEREANQVDRATRARLAQAADRVRPYLARLPDNTLQVLGFTPSEVAIIRADGTRG